MFRKFVIVFTLTVISDIIIAIHLLALAKKNILIVAIIFGGILPFMELVERAWFADAPTWKERLIITSASNGWNINDMAILQKLQLRKVVLDSRSNLRWFTFVP